MEATKEGLLDKIRPPRLEDAGLEDCALPLDSIKEAFLKAAAAACSTISPSNDDEEDSCVDDPWPVAGDSSDFLIGIKDVVNGAPDSCVTEKRPAGGAPELVGDEVVVAGAGENEEKADALAEPGVPEGGRACVDALQGLVIGEKAKKSSKTPLNPADGDGQNEDEKTEKPILIEDYA